MIYRRKRGVIVVFEPLKSADEKMLNKKLIKILQFREKVVTLHSQNGGIAQLVRASDS